MSQLEQVLERATIIFPRAQTSGEVEKLFSFLAITLPAEIEYKISISTRKKISENGEAFKKENSKEIIAFIRYMEKPSEMLNSIPDDNDYSKISALRFLIVPGWDLSNYRKETLDIWDKIKKLTGNYPLTNNLFKRIII